MNNRYELAPLEAANYYDEVSHLKDLERIFDNSWFFACMKSELSKPNDFVSFEVGSRAVVIQNFEGELKAFRNVCSHRYSRIQTSDCGNRKLICPFHGWTYDKSGVPRVPGNSDFFKIDGAMAETLKLPEYQIATAGSFVFVRLKATPQSLEAYLGVNYERLVELSQVCTTRIVAGKQNWKSNWKLAVESVLETYHVPTIHPDTFSDFVTRVWEIAREDIHSFGRAYLSERSLKWWTSVASRLKLRRSTFYKDYDHFLIFPNLAIGLTYGSLMSVQRYLPTSASTCDLYFQLYLGASSDHYSKSPIFEAAVQNIVKFNEELLLEDKWATENVARGLREVHKSAILGANEERIAWFHNSCKRFYHSTNP